MGSVQSKFSSTTRKWFSFCVLRLGVGPNSDTFMLLNSVSNAYSLAILFPPRHKCESVHVFVFGSTPPMGYFRVKHNGILCRGKIRNSHYSTFSWHISGKKVPQSDSKSSSNSAPKERIKCCQFVQSHIFYFQLLFRTLVPNFSKVFFQERYEWLCRGSEMNVYEIFCSFESFSACNRVVISNAKRGPRFSKTSHLTFPHFAKRK